MSLQYKKKGEGHYLAEPNGAVDHGDATSTGSIAWCVDNIPSGGGVVELVPGIYNFNQQLSIRTDKIVIKGLTRAGTILSCDQTSNISVILSSADQTQIHNVTMRGDPLGLSSEPMLYLKGTESTIDNVRIQNTSDTGIIVSGERNVINNIRITNTGGVSLKIDGDYTTLRNSYFSGSPNVTYLLHCTGDVIAIGSNHFNPSNASSIGIRVEGNHSSIRGNHFISEASDITLLSLSTASYNLIAGNIFSGYGTPLGTGVIIETASSENMSIGNIYRLLADLATVSSGCEYNAFVNDIDETTSGITDSGTGTWTKLL